MSERAAFHRQPTPEFTPRPFSNEEKLEAIERELKYRRRVYPARIDGGKMSPQLAARQIALMEAIAADYRPKAQGEKLL